jgi:hypothetical protein
MLQQVLQQEELFGGQAHLVGTVRDDVAIDIDADGPAVQQLVPDLRLRRAPEEGAPVPSTRPD